MPAVRTGERLRSTTCTTEVVVVRGTDQDVELCCGGRPLVELAVSSAGGSSDAMAPAPTVADGLRGTVLGKRYVDEATGIELLCTKPGSGDLTCDGRLLELKTAKPLPSSD
jgi:hypothetical protein